jgi:hypothetical protein
MALAHTLPQRRDDAIIVSEPSAEVRYESAQMAVS